MAEKTKVEYDWGVTAPWEIQKVSDGLTKCFQQLSQENTAT